MAKLCSMTGSSNTIFNEGLLGINIELNSVNNRFLEINFRIPDELRHLELKLKKCFQEKLARGKVDCNINIANHAEQSFILNNELLNNISSTLAIIENKIPNAKVNALEVLNYPGVRAQQSVAQDKIDELVLKQLTQTIDKLVQSRQTEGEKLKLALIDLLDKIEAETNKVKFELNNLVELERQKILEKISAFKLELEPQRLEQEVTLAAQKADVKEEYDRLCAHINEARNILNNGGLCGKRLDFLMQEFNREANTLASKAASLSLTYTAVDIKVLTEQMREQVQNIE